MRTENYIFKESQRSEEGAYLPEEVPEGIVYFSRECGLAVYRCPCGCGHKTYLSIDPKSGSHPSLWTLNGNTFSPSINAVNLACKSHYFIRNGKVQWA